MAECPTFLKQIRLLGLIYLLINLIFFVAVLILILGTMKDIPTGFSPGWILLLFPAIGILAGYWFYRQKFGLFRSFIMVVSLGVAALGIFLFFWVTPQLEEHSKSPQPISKLAQNEDQTKQFISAVENDDLVLMKTLEQICINQKHP